MCETPYFVILLNQSYAWTVCPIFQGAALHNERMITEVHDVYDRGTNVICVKYRHGNDYLFIRNFL